MEDLHAHLLDAGVSAIGQPYLVLEYVDGPRLSTSIRRDGLILEQVLPLALNLSWSWRSAFRSEADLQGGGVSAFIVGSAGYLDVQATYRLNARTRLSIAATNLSDTRDLAYEGTRARLLQIGSAGRQLSLTIDGEQLSVPEGSTILDACARLGKEIPTLCYIRTLHPVNVCRICVVEVEGARVLVPSCSRAVRVSTSGMCPTRAQRSRCWTRSPGISTRSRRR